MLSPRQIFEDNIRPADLLLKVFRLLEHDALNTEEGVLRSLRELVKADEDESLLVIYNEHLPGTDPRTGRSSAVVNQDAAPCAICCDRRVVTASTALETYLPILLRDNPARSDSAPRTRFRAKERREVQEPVQGI